MTLLLAVDDVIYLVWPHEYYYELVQPMG